MNPYAFLITAFLGSSALAQADDPSLAPPFDDRESWVEEVTGYARDLEAAKRDARRVALEKLQARLAARQPPLTSWHPTLADVERMVHGPGRAGRSINLEEVGVQHQWILPIRMPGDAELVLRDRQFDRLQRIGQGFGFALGILALAAVGSAARPKRRRRTATP